jgi:hypothetical protein
MLPLCRHAGHRPCVRFSGRASEREAKRGCGAEQGQSGSELPHSKPAGPRLPAIRQKYPEGRRTVQMDAQRFYSVIYTLHAGDEELK